MTRNTANGLIAALDSILDRERQALTNGALDQLTDLMTEKDEIIEQITAIESLEKAQLAPLREKVTRNQALLDSALSGIRAVAGRMSELRKVRGGLDTYDSAGRKTRFGIHNEPNLEKRA